MKADMDADGVIRISAETPTEMFALKVWCEKFMVYDDGSPRDVREKLLISWGLLKETTDD